MKTTLLTIGFLIAVLFARAQDFSKETSSVDEIITALYASISGEKDEPRKWELFEILFTENAQLIPTGKDQNGKPMFRSWSPTEYRQRSNDILLQNGFHEVEIHRVVESYGPVTHVFSTYESRYSQNDPAPFTRGINSIQLFNDGQRWWILNIYWSSETEENPIPEQYLP